MTREQNNTSERPNGGSDRTSGGEDYNEDYRDDIDRSWLAGRRDLLPLDTEGW
jgi:hypothetical protein